MIKTTISILRLGRSRILSFLRGIRGLQGAVETPLGVLEGMSWQAEIVLSNAQIMDLASLVEVDLPALAQVSPLVQLARPALYDWVAQAILICALRELHRDDDDKERLVETWLHSLRACGIRTAVDLDDVAGARAGLDVNEIRGRLFRALHQVQSAIKHKEPATVDRSLSLAAFTQDNLTKLFAIIDGNARWQSNIDEIEQSLETRKLGTTH